MNNKNYSESIPTATIHLPDHISLKVNDMEWETHPVFKGVYMKHLVKGADTDGHLSNHLVKINPGCEIGEHAHEAQIELNEVVSGKGTFYLGEKKIESIPGDMLVTPINAAHRVIAGQEGIMLFAIFSPALF